MSPEEKRASLLDDTADVAPEDRIYLSASEGTSFFADGKYFRNWQDVLAQFKKDLEGVELTPEQQEIYNAVTTPKATARIRINDLNELEDVFLHYGTRKKGGRKIISVHYAGLRNPVTALEVVNIGDVIRRGKLVEKGTSDHPLSRSYELTAEDGATLKVVLDYWRDGEKNRSVINLYSNRKPGAHNVSSRRLTDQEYNIPPSGENSSPETGKIEENLDNGAGNTKNTKNTGNAEEGTGRTGGTDAADIRFSMGEVDPETRRLVSMMQLAAGYDKTRPGEVYAKKFKAIYGKDLPPNEAKIIASMAVEENRAEAVRRYNRDALQFYRDSDPAFDFFLNFAGPEGKLNPGRDHLGEEFTGTAGRGAGRSVPRWGDGC